MTARPMSGSSTAKARKTRRRIAGSSTGRSAKPPDNHPALYQGRAGSSSFTSPSPSLVASPPGLSTGYAGSFPSWPVSLQGDSVVRFAWRSRHPPPPSGSAAAVAAGSAALALATTGPLPAMTLQGVPDPILQAIEAHKAARATWIGWIDRHSDLERELPSDKRQSSFDAWEEKICATDDPRWI